MHVRLFLAVALVGALPAVGSAAFVTFSDRAAWQAVAGTPTVTEDFQSFTQNAFIFPVPVQANGFSLTATRSVPAIFGNRVQVAPAPPPIASGNSPNGTNFFLGALINDLDADGTLNANILLTFTGEVSAFGADFRGANGIFIDVYGAGNVLFDTISPDVNTPQFYGFALTDGERAERLVFRTTLTPLDGVINVNVFGMDNVALVVPAPSGLVLAVLGLPALGLSRRLRRAGGLGSGSVTR